jgi:hypothetical protein
MSLGPTVALVAAGLAVVGGTSYVSLMHGESDSRAPASARVLDQVPSRVSINQFSAYLDATFASVRSTTRTSIETTTASIPRTSASFADRFAGLTSDVAAPSAPTRSITNPKVRTAAAKPPPPAQKIRVAALRLDQREPPAPEPKPYQVASYAPTRDDSLAAAPFTFRSDIRLPALPKAVTSLVPLDNAPFPVRSASGSESETGDRVHINFRSRVSWEKGAFSDPRVLLHIPKGFDPNKPAVMVVFYHGHGATLTRDVLNRQEVPEQISEAGANAVLVAPQLAFDARSSNPGKLWESGAFARMVREAGDQLTKLYGDPRAAKSFANMPIIIVAYSGGYLSAATSLERGGLKGRVRGVVLLDALYGELGGFADWISRNRSGFFVSSWTRSTQGRNAELERMLSDRDVNFGRAIRTANLNGNVVFLPGEDGIRHRDFVNHAWTDKPIKDILARLPEYRL